MNKAKTIILATGGTGGHVYPAIALANRLTEINCQAIFLTDNRGAKYINGYQTKILNAKGLSGNSIFAKLQAVFSLMMGIIQAFYYITILKPQVIVAFGGYASVPSLVVAVITRIPFIIHEQNAVFGRTNRFFAKWAKYIATSFDETQHISPTLRDKIKNTGNPIRANFINQNYQEKSNNSKFQILITGGSQAAKLFAEIVPQAILALPESIKNRLHVVQQVKSDQVQELSDYYKKNNISSQIQDFFIGLPEIYKNTNIFIGRAGASTIAEISAMGIPAILIPLAIAIDNHQYHNAQALADKGGAIIITESALNADKLSKKLSDLIENPEYCQQIHLASLKFAQPKADFALQQLVLEIINIKQVA